MKKLEELLDYIQPGPFIVTTERYNDEFKTPVLTAGQTFLLGYTDETSGIYNANKESAVILFDDFTTSFKWVDFNFKVKSSACKILIPKKGVNLRYVYYAMKRINIDTELHKRYWISSFSKQSIKYPDFEIQRNIVSVLDELNKIIEEDKKLISLLNELLVSKFNKMFSNEKASFTFDDVMFDDTKNGFKFDSSHYMDIGDVAIVDQGKKLVCGYKELEKNKPPYNNECIVFGDHTEIFKYVNFPFYLGADGVKVLRVKKGWNVRFIYEYLLLSYSKVGGYSRHFKYLKDHLFNKPSIEKQIEFEENAEMINETKEKIVSHIGFVEELLEKKLDEYFGGAIDAKK